jgi:probable phosphoglycerate mutase
MPISPDVRTNTSLYLVRHGETDYNRRGIVQGGGIDSSLNETGRRQARQLAERFRSVSFDAVYASTMQRARQTADILAEPHEPIRRAHLEELQEMSWGIYEGAGPSSDRDAELGEIKAEWRQGIFDRTVEGGESILDVRERAIAAMDRVMAEDAGQTVLVVTHGRYLRVLLASVLDEYSLDQMHQLDHSNTCVNRLVHTGDRFEARLLNCTAHLNADSNPDPTPNPAPNDT